MITYSIFFALSVSGMIIIALRHKESFAAFKFAVFIESLRTEASGVWHGHLRERTFSLLENILHRTRILFTKMEFLLFRALRRIRGIKEKNGSGNGRSDII